MNNTTENTKWVVKIGTSNSIENFPENSIPLNEIKYEMKKVSINYYGIILELQIPCFVPYKYALR